MAMARSTLGVGFFGALGEECIDEQN